MLAPEAQVHGGLDVQGQRASDPLRAQLQLVFTHSEVAAGRHRRSISTRRKITIYSWGSNG
jgi:hypothetical protein